MVILMMITGMGLMLLALRLRWIMISASSVWLWGVKVLDHRDSGYTSVIAMGLDWVTANVI